MTRTALVLGAGFGGLVTAEALRKLLPAADRVIAVDRAADHFFNVTRIDPFRRAAEIDGQVIAADALIIALGADYAPEAIPGLVDAGLNLYTMEGATAIRDALARFPGGRVPPHRAPAVARNAGLTNESGWIPVDRHTLQTSFDKVFAIGDITSIPLKMGRPLPKAGVFAHGQAEVIANNIADAWTGKGASRQFNGEGMCFIETGDARAGIGKGNFYAEPVPQVAMRGPSLLWHAGKILYEKYWLYRRF